MGEEQRLAKGRQIIMQKVQSIPLSLNNLSQAKNIVVRQRYNESVAIEKMMLPLGYLIRALLSCPIPIKLQSGTFL